MMDEIDSSNKEKKTAPPIWDALKSWGQQLSGWRKFIVANAVCHGTLSDEHINEAYQLFLRESELDDSTEKLADIPDLITTFDGIDTTTPVTLLSIQNMKNVNAIPDGTELPIGANLTVVYGHNGSGKSGFVRVLSDACSSRAKATILPNIHAGDDSIVPSADILFKLGNGIEETAHVPSSEDDVSLRRVGIFDSAVARVHLTEENYLIFQPSGFEIFNDLVRVIGLMASRLESDIRNRPTQNSFSALFIGTSNVLNAVSEIDKDTDINALRKLAEFGKPQISRLDSIDKELQDLRSPAAAIRKLEAGKAHIKDIQGLIDILKAKLSHDALREYRVKFDELQRARQERASFTAGAGQNPKLTQVGSLEWVQFIKAANALAVSEKDSYPALDDPCLLCHRPLDNVSTQLIHKFWNFLDLETHAAVETAQQMVLATVTELQKLSVSLLPEGSQRRNDLDEIEPDTVALIDNLSRVFVDRRNSIIRAFNNESLNALALSDMDIPVEKMESTLLGIDDKISSLSEGNVDELIARLNHERIELRHRQVLNQNIDSIVAHVKNLQWVYLAGRRRRADLNARFVTTKQNEFFKSMIEGRYKKVFERECCNLGSLIPINLSARGASGRTLRTLEIGRGYQPSDILSEGEQRIVALADFLTEINTNQVWAGVVFDDPVTSLDHLRKRYIAKRLSEESKVRQVIVFTHDPVFFCTLVKESEKLNVDIKTHWVQATNNVPGNLSLDDCPLNSKKYRNTKRAEESLRNAQNAIGQDCVDYVGTGASALRRTLEEIIIVYLLKETIIRWDERLYVGSLARINWDQEAVDEILNLYDEISRLIDAHSHSDAHTDTMPTPENLETLINRVKSVRGKVKRGRESGVRPSGESSPG